MQLGMRGGYLFGDRVVVEDGFRRRHAEPASGQMEFDDDTRNRLRAHVQGGMIYPLTFWDYLLAMIITAWVFKVDAKAAPQYVGESIQLRGDNMSAVHWVNRCRGGARDTGGRTYADVQVSRDARWLVF